MMATFGIKDLDTSDIARDDLEHAQKVYNQAKEAQLIIAALSMMHEFHGQAQSDAINKFIK